MKIRISGPATACLSEREITDVQELRKLHGLVYQGDEVLSDYLDDCAPKLATIGLIGGSLQLAFDETNQRLCVITEYGSPRLLKNTELKMLVDFTSAQWSDGVGEALYFHEYTDKAGISLDFAPGYTSEVRSEQIDDGVPVPKKRSNPLLKAASANDLSKMKTLIDKGEKIDERDKTGCPVLHWAIRHKNSDAVRLLIEKGADIAITDNDKSSTGHGSWQAIHLAASRGLDDLVGLLLDQGAKVDARDSKGATPLMHASTLPIAKMLIERGADVNARDTEGKSPLMYQSKNPDLDHRHEIIQNLLDCGADPNVREMHGMTAYENVGGNNKAAVILLDHIRARAEQGDGASQYTMGEYCERGLESTQRLNIPHSAEQSFQWFQRAAQNGYRLAFMRLGFAYQQGNGVAPDLEKALAYFEKAADASVPAGLAHVGLTKDPAECVKLLRKATEIDLGSAAVKPVEAFEFRQGVAICLAELGEHYENGEGVEKSLKEALRLYKAAHELGLSEVDDAIKRVAPLIAL